MLKLNNLEVLRVNKGKTKQKNLVPNFCEICKSNEELQKHHPQTTLVGDTASYNKTKEKVIVCRSCHYKLHKKHLNSPYKYKNIRNLVIALKPTILGIFLFLMLIQLVFAKSLTTSPSAVSIEYTLGDPQPADKSITFTNADNSSFSIALTKNGTGIELYNISATTLGFNGSESKAITMKFGISSETSPDLYSSRIWYGGGDEFIPVFITVKAKSTTTTGCKLLLPSELFSRSIKKGTQPFSQDFLLQVSTKCTEGIKVTDIRESGQVTVTEQGLQPIRLSGLIPKGSFEKGQTMTMNVEFDVSELQLGDYRSSIIITSTEGDEQLTQKMDFRIFVVGTASASNNNTFSALPSCSPSTSDLRMGQTYQFICNNVIDSNIKLNIDGDALNYLKGVSYDNPSNQIIWTFTPIKLGNTKLRTYFTFNGVPIGELKEYEIRIGQTSGGGLGTKLMFDFFPKTLDINNLKGGDIFSLLIKAVNPDAVNDSGTIIQDVVLYKDGVQIPERSFTANAGESFTLSASAIGFNSIEKTITVPLQAVSLSYSPFDIEIGRNVTFSTSPSDAAIFLDGVEIPKIYIFKEVGDKSLVLKREGYKDNPISIVVTEPLRALSEIPENIKIGEEVVIEYSKAVDWTVLVAESNETSKIFLQGSDNLVKFMPDRKAVYDVYVRNELVASYDLTGLTFSWGWVGGIVVGLVLLYLAVKYEWFRFRGNSGGRKPSERRRVSPFEMDMGGG